MKVRASSVWLFSVALVFCMCACKTGEARKPKSVRLGGKTYRMEYVKLGSPQQDDEDEEVGFQQVMRKEPAYSSAGLPQCFRCIIDCPKCPGCPATGSVALKQRPPVYVVFIHQHVSWPKAKIECERRKGKLAEVHSKMERALLTKEMMEGNYLGEWQGPWIGLSDVKEEGKFVWANDVPVDPDIAIFDKAHGYPAKAPDRNCVFITGGHRHQPVMGLWRDWHCDHRKAFACEYR